MGYPKSVENSINFKEFVLILTHAQRSIPFLIFEQDAAANSRLQGWALTIHFSLPQLLSLLPDDIIEQIDGCQVNPGIKTDTSNSIFINLSNCAVKWRLPPGSGTRKRVSRDRFRKLLMEKLDDRIHWQKRLIAFEPLDTGVRAKFHDGSFYEGLLLVGADGAKSVVRSLLYDPINLPPKPLPISFLGTSLLVNHAQIKPLLDLDPILFQGCHPESSTWMWFSVMESPETNGSIVLPLEQRYWKAQLCLSWPSADNRSEIAATDAARVLKMREKAENFDPRLRAIFHDALRLDHAPVLSIHLADWHLPPTLASNLQGRVTLVGDAAHTMAMYRGEGFNHAIVDVHALVAAIELVYSSEIGVGVARVREQVIERYELEIMRRGKVAVAMCREATMEVHQWEKLDEESVVRKKRIL